ncbi:MAG: hypothetical protein AAGA48_21790 [Myxococcota bacterium]
MTLWMVILGALVGCGSSTTQPTSADNPTASARGKAKVGKRGKRRGGRFKGKRRKGGKQKGPRMAPVGASGDVMGKLVLTKLEEPVKKANPTPTPEGTAGEAAATSMITRTKAELQLTWGENKAQTVGLGKVRGTCTDAPIRPVGNAGKEKTPLWTVRCADGDKSLELFILQVGQRISVVRESPGATPDAPKVFKPVKRIPLAQGATLKREAS